jgi:hypothetical protein
MTAPFLPSTSALSWQWLARLLVNSMRNFSNIPATVWLMYSEPLSLCNP